MTIDVVIVDETGLPSLVVNALSELLNASGLSVLDTGQELARVTLRVTDDDTIAGLHARYFGDPSPTDVITFPSHEPDDDGAAYIGDIVVSRTRAAEQGNDADHSTERELAFLALHGLLHLAGFRDDDDGEREEMLRRQEALLTEFEASENPPW